MGLYNSDETLNHMQYPYDPSNAMKPQDSQDSTRASTKSPNSGADAEEYQLMDELVDAEALARSQQYGAYAQGVGMMPSPTHSTGSMTPVAVMSPMGAHSPMGHQAVEMPGNMPQGYMFPSNAPVMYADMSSMQQGGPQVQMQWPSAAMQNGAMAGQPQQYQMMPMMMPIRMVPVPVPMQMGAQVPGAQVPAAQVPQQGYYLVQDAAEQQPPAPSQAEPETPKNFLEALMPTGWRKRQRPSKRPTARMQKVPSGRKIFVGGLSPNSTAESLINHFSEFGKISDASVIHEAVTRRSRGFGYVEFADKIPDGLFDMDHYIDQRRCGVRGYNYDPEDQPMGEEAEAAEAA
jgi:hypothetical protein